jgi:hypothetical protein
MDLARAIATHGGIPESETSRILAAVKSREVCGVFLKGNFVYEVF